MHMCVCIGPQSIPQQTSMPFVASSSASSLLRSSTCARHSKSIDLGPAQGSRVQDPEGVEHVRVRSDVEVEEVLRSARAEHGRFGRLGTLRAHTKAPYGNDLLVKTHARQGRLTATRGPGQIVQRALVLVNGHRVNPWRLLGRCGVVIAGVHHLLRNVEDGATDTCHGA